MQKLSTIDLEILDVKPNSCRICLKSCSKHSQDVQNFEDLYCICTGLQFDPDDIPRKICESCINMLYSINEFKELCEQTETFLEYERLQRNYVASITVAGESTVEILEVENEESVEQFHNITEEETSEFTMEFEYDKNLTDFQDNEAMSQQQQASDIFTTCKRCNINFSSSLKYHRHIKNVHSKEKNPRYYCAHCPASYKIKTEIKKHLKSKHTKEKPNFPCKFCDKIFHVWATRYYHILREHQQIDRFECYICGKKFLQKGKLVEHMHSHTGIRNYNCHECPLKFLRKSHLQRHIQTVHHIKAYQICPNCGRKFKHIKYLKQHMQKHGENHYKCPLCEASFSVSYALKSHMLKNHPGIEMPPPGTVLKNNLNFLRVFVG